MNILSRGIIASAAAGIFAVTLAQAPALAAEREDRAAQQQYQQQQLGQAPRGDLRSEDVEAFLEQAEAEFQQIVQTGDRQRLSQWLNSYVAEDATFATNMEVLSGGQRKIFAITTLERDDLLRNGELAVFGDAAQMIDDYSLDIEVAETELFGADAATVRTRISSSGQIRQPVGPDQLAEAERLAFERELVCSHIIHRDEETGMMKIGMTSCEGQTRL